MYKMNKNVQKIMDGLFTLNYRKLSYTASLTIICMTKYFESDIFSDIIPKKYLNSNIEHIIPKTYFNSNIELIIPKTYLNSNIEI